MNSNTEHLLGISEYISEHEGFIGIIKQRFSDFLVNEIDSSGQIIHLTSEVVKEAPSIPLFPGAELTERPPELTDNDEKLLDIISGNKKMSEVKPSDFIVPAENGASFESLKLEDGMREMKVDVTQLTKKRRSAIHIFVKARYPTLNSCTKEEEGKKFIWITKKGHVSYKERRCSTWPKSQSHVHFVLYKENVDTMDAINVLAGKLRLKPGVFSYAGTKDRRAKTSQLVSVYQVAPQNLVSASKAFSKKIRLGNFQYRHQPQKLGMTQGNRFRIVIREVTAPDDVINNAAASLRDRGFINYFGHQRFGSASAPTHTVGRALIKCNWPQAADLILQPKEFDRADRVEAKKVWQERRDPVAALRAFRGNPKACIEGQLLFGLKMYGPTNALNAIEQIPRNVKLIYIHAYQSHVWNRVVSKRLRTFGLKVIPGDLVRAKKSNEVPQDGNDVPAEVVPEVDGEEAEGNVKPTDVHILTEAESLTTDITEVVMPLPGFNMIYPSNETADWYSEFLGEDDLTLDSFKNKVRTFSMGGAYRNLVFRPKDFESSICYYNDTSQPLFASDLQQLNGEDVATNRLKEGSHKALLLEFSLPPSTYATMALRELLKIDTSTNNLTDSQYRPSSKQV